METRQAASELFGPLLRRRREAAGLSQEALGARAGLSTAAISALERGERRRPYAHTVRALADALDLVADAREEFIGAALIARAVVRRTTLLGSLAPLPLVPTPLIGRAADVTAIAGALAGGERLLTLTGTGGVGKTRLALAAASEAMSAFTDGVAFVSLAALSDPAALARTIGAALGVRDATLATLEVALHERRMLLVLDNLEQLLPAAAPTIAALSLGCPELTILATSRAPLRIRGERAWAVSPLALPLSDRARHAAEIAIFPAVQLFIALAGMVAPGFALTPTNAAVIIAICQRLDGLPLALELAAAWTRLLRPAELLARLDRALPLLTGGARDLPARQRTLRDTIAWSYDLLSEEERRLFRRLAPFVGGWTLDGAIAVAGAPSGDVVGAADLATLDGLASLLEKNLIVTLTGQADEDSTSRFGMLETIRAYAIEELGACGEETLSRDRHAAFYLALAAGAPVGMTGPEQAIWLERLFAEHDNLRAVLDYLVAHGRAAEGARLGWDLCWFWFIGGHATEGRRSLARVLAHGDILDPTNRARALCSMAALAFLQGDFAGAIAASDEALDILPAGVEPAVQAQIRLVRAIASVATGNVTQAAADATQSAAIARALGDHWGIGQALLAEVHLAVATGDLARARAAQADAERELRVAGAPWGIAYALNMRVLLGQLTDDVVGTIGPLREGVRLSRAIGDTIALYYGLTGLAGAAALAGSNERAARLFGAAEVLRERTGLVMPNPMNQLIYAKHLAILRAQMSADSFAAAWQAGCALSLTEAIDEALLAERDPADPHTNPLSPPL